MQAKVGMLCLLNRKKYNKFKNKKQPELPENQTIWKSNNQGVKKKHSSRVVGGEETGSHGGEGMWHGYCPGGPGSCWKFGGSHICI